MIDSSVERDVLLRGLWSDGTRNRRKVLVSEEKVLGPSAGIQPSSTSHSFIGVEVR